MSRAGVVSEMNRSVGLSIASARDSLAEAVTARHYQAHPELLSKYGEAGRAKCRQDAQYHLSYLADALVASSPSLFSDYLAWAKVMLGARGVPAADLSRNLSVMREVVREHVTPEAWPVVQQFFDEGLQRLPAMPEELPTLLADAAPHADLARRFLRLLLGGERHAAGRLIHEAVDSGVALKDVYLHVFQASQREIGRLWQMNQLSVAQEHYCTAATQLVMSQLYPRLFRTEKQGRRVVATSVAGELHEIGARIITDFFEMEGWDTYYLGANCPTADILKTLSERKPDLLAVSATMTFHVRAVEELVGRVRASEEFRGVKIMVGGYPFNVEPDLWKRVGADAYAADAAEAAARAGSL